MEPSQTVTETLITELTDKSFNTFCDDISGMFGIDINCSPQQVTHETVNGLKESFQDLAVIYAVNAEGALNGTFHVVLDRQGLFILAGVVAMQPDQVILEDAKDGSLEKAQKQTGILQEIGAAMVGSWERIFRKGLDGHERFTHADIFIGNPWDNPQETIGSEPDEQLSFVPYDMTVGFFTPFKCGIIFKKEFFAAKKQPGTEQPDSDQEKNRQQEESKAQAETEKKAPNVSDGLEETKEPAQDETAPTGKIDATQEPAADPEQYPDDLEQEPAADPEQYPDDLEQQPAAADEEDQQQERPISEAIKKLTQSYADSSDESTPPSTQEIPAINGTDIALALCAKDIMQKNIVWANPEDSVQQALAKIQQNDTGYMIVGKEQALEGIVSKSDLTGALSPYLRSMFAKYRRPLDDATLQIKVKWIMTKTTNTVQQDTPLSTIMEKMCQTHLRCLPVVDRQNKVLGLITVFDVFKAFLNQTSPE